jgi:hypothetical protein
MMNEDANRIIHQQGWRQGRLLPVCSHTGIASLLSLEPLADDDAVIVISQSCDLVHHDFGHEPFAEILLAHRLSESPDGNFRYLRNPRYLHFYLQIDSQKVAYKAWIWDRYRLPRQQLAVWPPDERRSLFSQAEHDLLISWLVARYERTALPDELQRRLGKIRDDLKKLVKKLDDVSAVFLECSDQELNADDVYQLRIKLVMPKDYYDQSERRNKIQQLIMKLTQAFDKCSGVQLEEEPELLSELEFSLHDARTLRRWNDFDYVSYQDIAAHQVF